jgi:hypothetical protein
MSHERVQCQHGYVLSQCCCTGECAIRLVACRDVPACPAFGPAEFTDDGCRCKCAWCEERNGKPVKAPTTGVRVVKGPDGRYSITGLSEEDMWTLAGGVAFVITESSSYEDTREDQRMLKILNEALPD